MFVMFIRSKSYTSVFKQLTNKLLQQEKPCPVAAGVDNSLRAGFSLGSDYVSISETRCLSSNAVSGMDTSKAAHNEAMRHPKRPAGAYACFMQKVFSQYHTSNPGQSVQDVGRHVSKAWNALSVEDKKEFFEKAKVNKESYVEAVKVFNEKLTDEEKAELKEQSKLKQENRKRRKLRAARRSLHMPKKPRNAYSYFVQTVKREKDEDVIVFARRCGEMWRKMDDAGKKTFSDLAQKDHDRYYRDIEGWEMQMLRSGNLNVIRSKSRQKTLTVMKKELMENVKSSTQVKGKQQHAVKATGERQHKNKNTEHVPKS